MTSSIPTVPARVQLSVNKMTSTSVVIVATIRKVIAFAIVRFLVSLRTDHPIKKKIILA